MEATKIFQFCAAHQLVDYDGPCSRLHGHNYELRVSVEGAVQEDGKEAGMVIDFGELKKIVNAEVLSILDHSNLNESMETDHPTAENIAIWVWQRLEDKIRTDSRRLSKIKLYETPTSYVVYKCEWTDFKGE